MKNQQQSRLKNKSYNYGAYASEGVLAREQLQKKKGLRTCIVCGKRFVKQDLLRYVWGVESAEVVADCKQVMDGRGTYCCLDDNCKVQFFKRTKGLKRALRVS